MDLKSIIKLDQENYMNTFGARLPVAFERGSGMRLYDTNGEQYLDFFAGIAVSCLGHSHPAYVKALKNQAEKLVHTSSLYYIEPQAKLAEKLCQMTGYDRAFFCNSGAEANEGAIKLAKIYCYKKGLPEKNEIITLKNSFHGRTLTTVAATGQEKYQKPYKPLTPGFVHVPMNDCEALKAAAGPKTCAIMMEVIQGESGVHPASPEFIETVQKLCKQHHILLIADEVQTGIGRTGSLLACEQFGVKPDIVTLAKALGGGVPIGAVLATQETASAFEPGDHGTTFGGNPFCTNAALCVLDTLEQEQLIENAKNMGAYFTKKLESLQQKYPVISEVRGLGLMLGVGFTNEIAKDVNQALFARHILAGNVGLSTLRILPPLIVTKADIDQFIAALDEILMEL